MSTLNDYMYAKCKALDAAGGDLNTIDFAGVTFLKKERRSVIVRLVKSFVRVVKASFGFVADLLQESPASYNERIRRSSINPPPIRGLW